MSSLSSTGSEDLSLKDEKTTKNSSLHELAQDLELSPEQLREMDDPRSYIYVVQFLGDPQHTRYHFEFSHDSLTYAF